jgi:hypothetical protein
MKNKENRFIRSVRGVPSFPSAGVDEADHEHGSSSFPQVVREVEDGEGTASRLRGAHILCYGKSVERERNGESAGYR